MNPTFTAIRPNSVTMAGPTGGGPGGRGAIPRPSARIDCRNPGRPARTERQSDGTSPRRPGPPGHHQGGRVLMDDATIRDRQDDQVGATRPTPLDVDQPSAPSDQGRPRKTIALAVAAVTALTIAVAPSVLRGTAGLTPRAPATPATGPTKPTGPVSSTMLAVPRALNPAVRYGAFGWLPAG